MAGQCKSMENADSPGRAIGDLGTRVEVDADILALWGKFQGHLLARVETLEEAVVALTEARLDDELRGRAERDAHRLAGSAGTFGRHRASILARELEQLFAGSEPIDLSQLPDAASKVELIRKDLRDSEDEAIVGSPSMLIVHKDASIGNAIRLAAETLGLVSRVFDSVGAALAALPDIRPEVVLVDLDVNRDHVLSFVKDLSNRKPPVVILALNADIGFSDRVEAVRAGVQGFLPMDLSASELVTAAVAALEATSGERWRVLAVDDDPAVLGLLAKLLPPGDFLVSGVTEPEDFWAALSESTPDLVILDLDMPGVSGIELCHLLRVDPRWSTVPVVFLTSHVSPDAIKAVFAVGADDYVAKPVIGPELVNRITNRLERARVLRLLAETDPLTGLSNRRKFEAQWKRLQAMADRYNQPLCFALLDLDRFRDVNNLHGHDTGDAVLRRIAQLLLEQFRGQDVVARWGGEEIALAMYGITTKDGVHRLTYALELLRNRVIMTPSGVGLRTSYSAGVSQYREDGTELHDLYRRADERLYQAKSLGRSLVMPAD